MLMLLHQMVMMLLLLHKISAYTSISNDDQNTAHVDVAPPNETLSNAWIKKEVPIRSSKRQKNWMGRKNVQCTSML
jgi:hypothetical protein